MQLKIGRTEYKNSVLGLDFFSKAKPQCNQTYQSEIHVLVHVLVHQSSGISFYL